MVSRYLLEAASADSVLDSDEGLHTAHGHVGLLPHVVAAHQRLEAHEAAQRPQRPPRLREDEG